MKKSKLIIAVVVTLAMIIGLLAGCMPQNGTSKVDTQSEKEKDIVKDEDVPDYINKEGFPIVKKPVTLTAMVS